MKLHLRSYCCCFWQWWHLPGVIHNSVYHASSDYGRVHPKYHEGLTKEKTETEHADAAASEKSELARADDEDSDGYYGDASVVIGLRTLLLIGTTPIGCLTGPYPYYASPAWYYPYRPFYGYSRYYYGYRAPYYRYYGGYYPYRNVYRRYHSGSRYTPLSRRTYKKAICGLEIGVLGVHAV